MEFEKDDLVPVVVENLKKSNYLIGVKYKASVWENKITYLAMLKIQQRNFTKRPDGIYVEMSASEIKSFLKSKSGNFYKQLAKVADNMTGTNFGIVDEKKEEFDFITLINRARYKDGVFMIRFANELKDHLIDVNTNYTRIPYHVAASFKRSYTFPLYQLLKSYCYYPSSYRGVRNNVFKATIQLSELKLDIGVINANEKKVKDTLKDYKGSPEGYDIAVSKAIEKMFDTWAEFKRRCLEPSIAEINDLSDIYVKYEKIKKGKRVVALEFTIFIEGAEKRGVVSQRDIVMPDGSVEPDLSQMEKFQFWIDVTKTLMAADIDSRAEDVVAISEAAGYQIGPVQQAVAVRKAQKKPVDNETGFIISAIKEGWEVPQSKSEKKKKESSYDFDELQRFFAQELINSSSKDEE